MGVVVGLPCDWTTELLWAVLPDELSDPEDARIQVKKIALAHLTPVIEETWQGPSLRFSPYKRELLRSVADKFMPQPGPHSPAASASLVVPRESPRLKNSPPATANLSESTTSVSLQKKTLRQSGKKTYPSKSASPAKKRRIDPPTVQVLNESLSSDSSAESPSSISSELASPPLPSPSFPVPTPPAFPTSIPAPAQPTQPNSHPPQPQHAPHQFYPQMPQMPQMPGPFNPQMQMPQYYPQFMQPPTSPYFNPQMPGLFYYPPHPFCYFPPSAFPGAASLPQPAGKSPSAGSHSLIYSPVFKYYDTDKKARKKLKKMKKEPRF